MFRLEQPEIKISKSFQITTQYVYVLGTQTDYQN